MKRLLNFIIIGPPGSGKGTQAKLLQKHFHNAYYLSTGDWFRDLIRKKSEAAQKIKLIVDSGGLPLDEISNTLWIHDVIYNVKEGQNIIFDGVTRRLAEARALDVMMRFLGRKDKTYVLLIHISERESYNRLTKRRTCKKCGQLIPWLGKFKNLKKCNKCGGELIRRADDEIGDVKRRLFLYRKRTIPAINCLKKRGYPIFKIDGEQSIENVFKDILKAIK